MPDFSIGHACAGVARDAEVSAYPTGLAAVRRRVGLQAKLASFVLSVVAISYAGHDVLSAHHTGFIGLLASVLLTTAVAWVVAYFLFIKPNTANGVDALSAQLEAAQVASQARLVALDQLRHSDRIATLGRLASSVAHELGNPLSVIELRAQLIASGDASSLLEVRLNASVIVEQAQRMTDIVDQILSFARMKPASMTRLNVGKVLRQAVALSEHIAKKHQTHIVLDLPQSEIDLDGDFNRLLQVVINLIVNGLQAMPTGGTLQVNAREEHLGPSDHALRARDFVCIEVVDHGVGISPDLTSHVFDPFYSTKSAQGGTGLGLSVAQGIAQEHDGWITVASELGRGSCFTVHLPKWGTLGSGP